MAAAASRFALTLALTLALGLRGTSSAAEEQPREADAPPTGLRVESVAMRFTAYEQQGHGYQSQAGPPSGPGSERMTVFQPQLEVNVRQGARIRHRLWVPVDIVTAASPDAVDKRRVPPDVLSGASRHNEAASVDETSTYRTDAGVDLGVRAGTHLEEDFRSWHAGLGASVPLADGATVVSTSVLGVLDWFDHFDTLGHRLGRANRSSTTFSAGLTQLVSPTLVVHVDYGVTFQSGTLGNTWNTVPLEDGTRGPELLPERRVRHALAARAAQYLPWDGALRLYYRFYADDWGLGAHTAEVQLLQRLAYGLHVGPLYRFHRQTGVAFFTSRAALGASYRVADSDLARFDAHAFGAKASLDLDVNGLARHLHLDVGYERYVRSNDLQVNVVSFATGYRF